MNSRQQANSVCIATFPHSLSTVVRMHNYLHWENETCQKLMNTLVRPSIALVQPINFCNQGMFIELNRTHLKTDDFKCRGSSQTPVSDGSESMIWPGKGQQHCISIFSLSRNTEFVIQAFNSWSTFYWHTGALEAMYLSSTTTGVIVRKSLTCVLCSSVENPVDKRQSKESRHTRADSPSEVAKKSVSKVQPKSTFKKHSQEGCHYAKLMSLVRTNACSRPCSSKVCMNHEENSPQ